MDIDLKTAFKSHSEKYLQDHLQGVMAKVRYRTANLPTTLNLKLAEIAALFHDLGKINPNFQYKIDSDFQDKLAGKTIGNYSSHAYISAYSWLKFCEFNPIMLSEWLGDEEKHFQRKCSIATMVSKHHGNLSDFYKNSSNIKGGVFNTDNSNRKSPAEELNIFLKNNLHKLPISDFLRIVEASSVLSKDFNSFYLEFFDIEMLDILDLSLEDELDEGIIKPLEFFLETQFCFACLLEADKRDAGLKPGEQTIYNRQILRENYFEGNFAKKIDEKLNALEKEKKSPLNDLRTAMRFESVANLREKLPENNKRIFTLSAPTGAGKTMMLLALAKEILAKDNSLSVIYALPFLSITEQVEGICRKIFADKKDAVLRIDSRAENQTIQELQKKLDDEQTDENVKKLLQESFTETTFDHPFIITTFVQVFEALLSNRNATLLRLPNFSKTVFLIDEIQALPYRLYSFFTALLDEFCRHFDSYAIISTATMPHLDFSKQQTKTHIAGRKLFSNYETPDELLNATKYFREVVFNRYRITRLLQEDFTIDNLSEHIKDRDESCLVILNTIDDTKDLYELLSQKYRKECVLLNTHFTLEDRRVKIENCQIRLKNKQKIILISTQLIEAGVDINFPTVYRDFCPLPSLIQSAGRCNRNGELKDKNDNLRLGEVFFFALRKKEGGKLSSELIYQNEAKNFLEFCRERLPETITESELFDLQKEFFEIKIGEELKFGEHRQYGEKLDFVELINKAAFEQLGKFKLIDERQFGCEFRYYIPKQDDGEFKKLKDLSEIRNTRDYKQAMEKRSRIETQLRKMSARIVTFRVKDESFAPAPDGEEVFRIRKLGDLNKYTFERGIELKQNAGCIM